MNMKTAFTRSIWFATAAVLAGAGLRADITVKGSDTLVILAQKWA